MRNIEEILAGWEARGKADKVHQQTQDEAEKPTASRVHLPRWPEPVRGVPNSTLRGALFAGIQGKYRRYMKGELLAIQQGMQIRFTGMQFDQSDLDVWELVLHLARQYPLGTYCKFTLYAFLKALDRRTGKKDHEWLKNVFRRLAGAVVEITHNGKTYFGSLIEDGFRNELTGVYVLNLNPDLVKLYGVGMWTAIDWRQRQQLRRKPLALWLHGFYASHAEPYPIKIESLMEWSGSQNKQQRYFKRHLKIALRELETIGAITAYEIDDNGLVQVDRIPSVSQQRHLRGHKPKRPKR